MAVRIVKIRKCSCLSESSGSNTMLCLDTAFTRFLGGWFESCQLVSHLIIYPRLSPNHSK